MRKTYWRLVFIVAILIPSISLVSLILTIFFQTRQDNFVTCLYPSAIEKNFIGKSSTIPPHHLLIPYREFVQRTTISCRWYKLDDPPEDKKKFHPKFSKFLLGNVPLIVPSKNITFFDVENFYLSLLPTLTDENKIISLPFAKNITFQWIPYQFENQIWMPINVVPAQRVAIIIPLQGRDYNAKTFLLNIHAFARRQQLAYTIILVEQVAPADHHFNKGRLFNTAINYIDKQSINIDCIIFHDVDLLPENDKNFYYCEKGYPKHTTSRIRQMGSTKGYNRYYEFLIGGVLMMTPTMYKTLNGFSNMYWGWGGEDDDLSLRLIERRFCVVRPDYSVAVYSALPHPRGQRNPARFNLLTWATVRRQNDGYAQIEPLTKIVTIKKSPIVTHLKIDVDVDGNFAESLMTEKVVQTAKTNPTSTTRTAERLFKGNVRKRKH